MKNLPKSIVAISALAASFSAADIYAPAFAATGGSDSPLSLHQNSTQQEAQKIADGIYKATGFGNTFLVTTSEGNVVIDTSLALYSPAHKKLLDKVSAETPKYIILTHGHGDHTGGVPVWRGKDTKVIAQKNSAEFHHYQKRLSGFFARQNGAQFGLKINPGNFTKTGNYDAKVPGNLLFDQKHNFKLGELSFNIASAPSETLDALIVYIPERKAVFVGDLIYTSFPNIYTLRGTKPRWALDYVRAINDVLALNAELLIPSHGEPTNGAENVTAALTKYRDAILYVHDATVAGMNAGKDVFTLMDEIKLPKELELGQDYGTVAWSVRGIYDGYIGWFDGNPSTMLGIDPTAANKDLVKLAGGPDAVFGQAQKKSVAGDKLPALALTDSILSVDPHHKPTLRLRMKILASILEKTTNFNEAGWLRHGIREAERALEH